MPTRRRSPAADPQPETPDAPQGQASAAEWVACADLVPWDRNPRDNASAVAPVAESLKRFGFAAPIIAQQGTRRVIAGHTRLLAAKSIGLAEVPVRFVDLDDDEASALALADNKLGELADWSDDLGALLGEMEASGVHLDGLGWDAAELSELIAEGVPREPSDDPLPAVTSSRLGEIWDLGPHRLMCGDATDPGHRARLLLGETPGVTVLDPPYEMPEHLWTRLIADPCILFGQAKHLRAAPESLWRFERVIDKVTAHRSATVQIGHRHAFVAQLGTVKTLPSVSTTFPSVISHPDRPDHPHEKPVDLLVEHLTHWTPPWDLVVDWFGGSGSTLIAASMMGRRAAIMEFDPECCDHIRARWERFATANKLDAATPKSEDGSATEAGTMTPVAGSSIRPARRRKRAAERD